MATPVLTAGQQRQALSAKKKKTNKVTIKNILVTPYTNYWPLVNDEDSSALSKVLEENLVMIKTPKPKIPWKELSNIPQKERKLFRLNWNQEECHKEKPTEKSIVFGINEVSKLLQSDAAAGILINSEVSPQLMLKHVIDEAVLKNVPVLVIPNLSILLRKNTGINGLAFAIKSNENTNYSKIVAKIREISVKYPVSNDHINFLSGSTPSIELKSDNNEKSNTAIENESEPEEDFHLKRTSKTYRVFEPEKLIQCQKDDQMDFIELEDLAPIVKKIKEEPKQKVKISYKKLLINRVVNNSNRKKKK